MSDFCSYANAFQAQPRLGLTRVRDLLARLGDPQKKLRCIHIGGTNGKGSVAVFLDSILRHAGYRVGRYMSPNLCKVNERITVNGLSIDDSSLDRLLERMRIASRESEEATGEIPTQFEIWTAAAFFYFAEMSCDYVVLEVGMGGAYDATNVIEECVMSVLTHIDYDHMEHLGQTLREIARTKCGIIKEACETQKVISAPQSQDVEQVIREEAEKHGNTVLFVTPPPPRKHYGMQEVFYFDGYGDIRSGLAGVHQIENACVALTCAKELGVDIFDAQCGITFAKHPARMEILRTQPTLVYDGGHNPNGVAALMHSLDRYWGDIPRNCIYACMHDKEYRACLRLLSTRPTRFIFTQVAGNPRALSADDLTAAAREEGINGVCAPNLAAAIDIANENGLPTLICGSLYLYADLPSNLRSL